MSTMSGNPHAKDSENLTEMMGENWIAHEGMTDATGIATMIQANTEATLALAFEQRTATMLKSLSWEPTRPGDSADAELQAQIVRRLGLDGDAS